jgi:tetratricopeptide (TPR) repeat protein
VGGHKGGASVFTPPGASRHPPRQGEGTWAQAAGGGALDAHPVVRQHFGRRLKEANHDAFREANRRLYEHYKALPEMLYVKRLPDTLEEMQPLFAAIAHGCAAGLHQEVFDKVHYERLYRRNEKYLVHKLGGLSADLGALAHYFDPPWRRPHPSLRAEWQAGALNLAGYALRALGRLREAVEPIHAAVRLYSARQEPSEYSWRQAALNASNLSELLQTLGDVGRAVAAAREGIVYADKSGDAFWRMCSHITLADALHQAGDVREAEALFAEADRLQTERQPELPRLYSLQGYRLCDLLLAQGRHVEVAERATTTLGWYEQLEAGSLLTRALDRLSLGRAAHLAWRAAGGAAASVPSPLVGEGQGGGDRRTSDVRVPPPLTPPHKGGGNTPNA